jgi:hypothetical protein
MNTYHAALWYDYSSSDDDTHYKNIMNKMNKLCYKQGEKTHKIAQLVMEPVKMQPSPPAPLLYPCTLSLLHLTNKVNHNNKNMDKILLLFLHLIPFPFLLVGRVKLLEDKSLLSNNFI